MGEDEKSETVICLSTCLYFFSEKKATYRNMPNNSGRCFRASAIADSWITALVIVYSPISNLAIHQLSSDDNLNADTFKKANKRLISRVPE